MDLRAKLKKLRRSLGLSQKDVAERAGLGVKTISSFETGERIDSLKLSQLRRILRVYGVSEAEFFRPGDPCSMAETLLERMRDLPPAAQERVLTRISRLVSSERELHTVQLQHRPFESEFHLLTSPN